ncbi:MAG TPA: hypothetical protein VN641_05535 [Urbifossiella sp.]|nr:hypothetical protein [Urbifossiella sp.]
MPEAKDKDQKDLQILLTGFQKLLSLLPKLTAPRSAFPQISAPLSGATLTPGFTMVAVGSNRLDLEHRVRLFAADDPTTELDNQLVTRSMAPNSGNATITIPAAGASDTDYLIDCRQTGGTTFHQILVTVKGTVIAPAFSITISANKQPPYRVGDVVTFTATGASGTPPYFFGTEPGAAPAEGWFGTGVPVPSKGPQVVVTFMAATMNGTVQVIGKDSTPGAMASVSLPFGPFAVTP